MPVLIFLVYGVIADHRFIFVALILIFIAIPQIMAIAVLTNCATIDTQLSIMPHSLSVDNDNKCLIITFANNPDDDRYKHRVPVKILSSEITRIVAGRHSIIYYVSNHLVTRIYCPDRAFDSYDDFVRFTQKSRMLIRAGSLCK